MRNMISGVMALVLLVGPVSFAEGIISAEDDNSRGVIYKTEKRDLDKKHDTGKVTETEYIGMLRHLKERYPVLDGGAGGVQEKEEK